MKIDRLLGITIYLLNHQKATAQELADRFEVSTRTIMRDMDTLSLSGIPIVTLYGSSGGYELLDTYKMDRQLTNDQDYSYIVTALQGLQSAFQQKEVVRMEDIFITGEKNCKVHMLEEAITKWEQSQHQNQTIQVKLFCNNRIKAKVEEYLNGTVIEEYQNGDFIYEMWVPENEHFWYGTVLGLSKYIKVIEPASLIERIKADCKQILEKYEEV